MGRVSAAGPDGIRPFGVVPSSENPAFWNLPGDASHGAFCGRQIEKSPRALWSSTRFGREPCGGEQLSSLGGAGMSAGFPSNPSCPGWDHRADPARKTSLDGNHVAPGETRKPWRSQQAMKALILAAGRGSRLGSLTERTPKCLIRVHGRSLLQHQLLAMRQAGLKEIGIVTGYLSNKINLSGLKKIKNRRWKSTYGVYSMLCASRWFGRGPVIVSYGDIFYMGGDLRRLVRSRGNLAVSYDPNWLHLWKKRFKRPAEDAESFRIYRGRIREIGARRPDLRKVQGQFMGLLKFGPGALRTLRRLWISLNPEVRDKLDMTGMLRRLIADGHKVTGVPIRGPWGEVDSVRDLKIYQKRKSLNS